MSKSGYFVLPVIYIITLAIFRVARELIPDSHQLLFMAITAAIALSVSVYEGTIIKKSIYLFLLFFAPPLVFSIVSLILWFQKFSVEHSLWMTYVFRASVTLISLIIFLGLVERKLIK